MDYNPLYILLVEDNAIDARITLKAFEAAEMKNKVFIAEDGQMGLDWIYGRGKYSDRDLYPLPDLILLDINLPKVNGFDVLVNLKNNNDYKQIPVIMLTASELEVDMVKSYRSGAASYINKPVNPEDFLKAVEKFNHYWIKINKLPPRSHKRP
jgi:two-component system, response regulator